MSAYEYGQTQVAALRREHMHLTIEVQRLRSELSHLTEKVRAEQHKVQQTRQELADAQPTEEIRAGGKQLIDKLKTTYPEDEHLGPVRLRAADREANANYYRTRPHLPAGKRRDNLGRYAA